MKIFYVSFSDRSTTRWNVVLGSHHLLSSDPNQIQSSVAKIIVHENYDEDLTTNDIALVKLSSPVTLNNYVNIACLPSHVVSDSATCYSTGFGDTMGK